MKKSLSRLLIDISSSNTVEYGRKITIIPTNHYYADDELIYHLKQLQVINITRRLIVWKIK